MPEGPEVKTVARTLDQQLKNMRLGNFWHSDYKLRREVNYQDIKKLENRVISSVTCYGKILFINSEEKPILLTQLGMTGRLTVEEKTSPLQAHTHIRWDLLDTSRELRYVDPRRFGLFEACDQETKKNILNKLGPDLFNLDTKQIPELIARMQASKRAIKEILLDQNILVGVGNIYASEALFLAKINPQRLGCDISNKLYKILIKSAQQVLELAYKNSGTTFSSYVDAFGTEGKNLDFLQVFQRTNQACYVCSTPIVRITQSNRSTFYCEVCQK